MNNTLFKDTFREIKKSLGRFISIFIITTLGVAFYTGVKSAAPDMKITADSYYDENNLMDIYLMSNLGLTEEDAEEIKRIQGVDGVFPTYSKDVLVNFENSQIVTRVSGLPIKEINEGNKDYINRPELKEGRFPEGPGECVIENPSEIGISIPIGTKIRLNGANEEDLSSSLKYDEYTIVGRVQTPYYLSYDKGSSSIGNGKVGTYVMIPQDDFNMEVYTEIYATVENAKKYNSYGDDYKEFILPIKNKIEDLGKTRALLRRDDIVLDANKEIEKGREELEKKSKEAEDKLLEAEEKLNDGKKLIESGELELENNKKNVQVSMEQGEIKLREAESDLVGKEKELKLKQEEFINNKHNIEEVIKAAEGEITSGENTVKSLNIQLEELKKTLGNPLIPNEEKQGIEDEIRKLEATIQGIEEKIKVGKKELEDQKKQFIEGETSINQGFAAIISGKAELKKQRQSFADGKIKAEKEFILAQKKIDNGKTDIAKGEEEYTEAKEEAEKQIRSAKEKIKDSEAEVEAIKEGQWYVLDREANYSFMEFGNSAESINAISKVFPLIFFLVAALICLTTMTRMVEEQRSNIGTMKALGYSKLAIVFKYIVYGATASIAGSILGSAIGYILFPKLIFTAYTSTYMLPSLILKLNLESVIGATIIVVGITIVASLMACYKELTETPALLMRPKAPKEGKRILLERMSFIWGKMNFIQKVTARNIFRYKKRFFMTVIGIAGCSALILVGFGLKNSITSVVSNQYEGVYKYDGIATYKREVGSNEENEGFKEILRDNRITSALNSKSTSLNVWNDKEKRTVTLLVPEKKDQIKNFMKFKNRRTEEEYNLSHGGVIITEKIAKILDLKIGDNIYLENKDKEKLPVKIDAIVENYIGHYVYMSAESYSDIFGEDIKFNQILLQISENNIDIENELSKDISEISNINSINFNSYFKDSFGNMIRSLNYVVLVLIISAGALAFVVLYNLTNVNISERLREIATIKVLGFYDQEVSAYVFRENMILTTIGAITGLGLGIVLHKFIIITAELESLMFGRDIEFSSYIYAMIMTVIFGVLVNWFMHYKLKKIEMVESLKSVD